MSEETVRVQVMVELTEREQRALSHRLGRKVLLRADVRRWALELVRARVRELVQAHEACECRRYFPHMPRSMQTPAVRRAITRSERERHVIAEAAE